MVVSTLSITLDATAPLASSAIDVTTNTTTTVPNEQQQQQQQSNENNLRSVNNKTFENNFNNLMILNATPVITTAMPVVGAEQQGFKRNSISAKNSFSSSSNSSESSNCHSHMTMILNNNNHNNNTNTYSNNNNNLNRNLTAIMDNNNTSALNLKQPSANNNFDNDKLIELKDKFNQSALLSNCDNNKGFNTAVTTTTTSTKMRTSLPCDKQYITPSVTPVSHHNHFNENLNAYEMQQLTTIPIETITTTTATTDNHNNNNNDNNNHNNNNHHHHQEQQQQHLNDNNHEQLLQQQQQYFMRRNSLQLKRGVPITRSQYLKQQQASGLIRVNKADTDYKAITKTTIIWNNSSKNLL